MGEMACPVGWNLKRLGDLGEVNRGRSRHRPRYADHLYGGPYPFIQTGDIRQSGGRITEHSQTYSEAGLAQSRLWPAETMCITIAANIAETAILTYPACFPDSVVGFIADSDVCDVRFVEYMFRFMKRGIQHQASGSVQDNINLATLEQLYFPTPDVNDQRAIAGVLGALDDKIEQNRRTARALERLARAIFRAWFVDFEPVKAKAAGAASFPSMPQAAFDALPTRMVDSAIGPVPEGWEVGLGHVAELERKGWLQIGDGYRAKRVELANDGVPFIRAGNVNGLILTRSAEQLGAAAVSKAGVKRSQLWDTVFTSKGTVGRIGLVTPATGDVVYAPQVCFWRAVDHYSLSPFFLHLWIKSDCFVHQWMPVKGQTDMADFVSLSNQRAMVMLVPPTEIQQGLDAVARPLIELQAMLAAESSKLADLRDLLLPKLLSGKVRVGEAGATAEGVGP